MHKICSAQKLIKSQCLVYLFIHTFLGHCAKRSYLLSYFMRVKTVWHYVDYIHVYKYFYSSTFGFIVVAYPYFYLDENYLNCK